MKKTFPTFILIIVIIIGIYYWQQETWTGFYYPNGCLVCEDRYIINSSFKNKESCFNWAESLKEQRNNPNDLYECGKNCKLQDGGFYICKETLNL